jgi:hypothetical protein
MWEVFHRVPHDLFLVALRPSDSALIPQPVRACQMKPTAKYELRPTIELARR